MAYNNFPIGYQPAQYYYPQQVQQTQNNGIIWVQGEAGAKSYLVAPNSTVQLWDSENQVIYLKSADASGMPSMRILDYQIREASNQPSALQKVPNSKEEYVTKEELKQFKESMENRLKMLSEGGMKNGE